VDERNGRFDALMSAALALPVPEREQFVHWLIESLDPDDEASPDEVERAWDEELARRIEDVRSGRVRLIPSSEVLARARALLGYRPPVASDAAAGLERDSALRRRSMAHQPVSLATGLSG
jgi:putative addiction module component (TIGR02574 family)